MIYGESEECKRMFVRKSILLSVLICLVCFFSTLASTQEFNNQPYKIIKTSELKVLCDSKAKDFLVIDTRNPEEFQDVHIPRAINIPQKKFDVYKHLLPEEKTTRFVFYCNGVK